MISNSDNTRKYSKEQDFLNEEEELRNNTESEETGENSSEDDTSTQENQEDMVQEAEKSQDDHVEKIQKTENPDETDEEIKAALVSGGHIDEKAKVEEKSSEKGENEASSADESSETSNETQENLKAPLDDNNDPGMQMEEMSTVEEMDDIGQSEEDFAKEEEDKEEEKEEEEKIDYATYTKAQLVAAAADLLKEENVRKADNTLKEIKGFYTDIYSNEKQEALDKFIAEGGVADDFDYNGDDLDAKFESAARTIKEKKDKFLAEMEKSREQNLAAKNNILEKLRKLVDSEENTTSITALKEIQNEWRAIGPVPSQYVRSLWANYSALIDRFYDNRSIYFELKELDRKKNLEAKIDICERAEKLAKMENLKEAIKELNDLHEEYKHIGPAPREEQEALWKRFKAASDIVYTRRRDFVENLKTNLKQNLDEKHRLSDAVQEYVNFDSDKITDWNAKTKEVLELQKKWEAIGGLPREHARDINKQFWTAFKKFFNNKSNFFKRLEGQRDSNLKLKEELITRAENLKESDDWEKTANELKELQREWKEIGPVPEKVRNEIYQRFKKACDAFFERKRSTQKETEKDYVVNLRRKEEICATIEKLAADKSSDIEQVEELLDEYNGIGFVPRNSIKTIQKRFNKAVESFATQAPELSSEDRRDLVTAAQYQKLRSSPNANKKIQRKENSIRRQIGELENDIALWKNNIEFFASSASAEKLKEEFNEKIANARKELDELKQQLKVIRTI